LKYNKMETKELTQEVFENQPADITIAAVDYDGLLTFGKNPRNVRYTWASERWCGFDKVSEIEDSGYTPLTKIEKI